MRLDISENNLHFILQTIMQ